MKDVKDYEGLYGITSCGKVYSYKSKKFLKPISNGKGYLGVNLYKNGKKRRFYIHRLVAEAYLPNPAGLPEVNHKDEIKSHNWLNNLEWCDRKYNACYSFAKKVRCVETGQIFDSITDAAREMHISAGYISAVCKGKRRTCGYCHWEYID